MTQRTLSGAMAWLWIAAACGGGDDAATQMGANDTQAGSTASATVMAAAGGRASTASASPPTAAASPSASSPAAMPSNVAMNRPAAMAGAPAVVGGAAAPSGGKAAPAANGGSGGVMASAGAGAGAAAAKPTGTPTLFFLDNTGARVLRTTIDGKQHMAIVSGKGVGPDGVAVDAAGGHVFWTNMGLPNADDGTVMRADLDGKNPTTIVPSGTFTPKQLKLEPSNNKLYWSDREGMRVMRSNLDGSELTTLVVTGTTDADRRDASKWCVGIAVDAAAGKLYWTQKGGDNAGQGTIKRASLELPAGQDPAARTDIEVLFSKLPEPIDLDLDLEHHLLYWTDRGDNTVSRAPLDPPAGFDPAMRKDREILVRGLAEAIGIALDVPNNRMFYGSLAGVLATAALDGSGARDVLTGQGTMTGIALVSL